MRPHAGVPADLPTVAYFAASLVSEAPKHERPLRQVLQRSALGEHGHFGQLTQSATLRQSNTASILPFSWEPLITTGRTYLRAQHTIDGMLQALTPTARSAHRNDQVAGLAAHLKGN